jgi:hypothetical protein
MATFSLQSETTNIYSFQTDGNNNIFAGISLSQGSPPAMSFLNVNMADTPLNGNGVVMIQGQNATVTVGAVGPGTTFEVIAGTLAIEDPLSFAGTIGPTNGPGSAAIGVAGEVNVYNALATAGATFDTSTGVLSLLDSVGQVLANLHLAGDVSGVHVTKFAGADYIAINDGADAGIGVGGNIAVTVTT